MKKLSIIVPVYNVEKYISPCLQSIFKQGLDYKDFEVIIVNDGSTDHSMEMIADIISQHNNIVVINQKNLSLSVARNNGIAVAKGDYILMPDSDDLLIENSIKPLLAKAIETKADLVVANFLKMTSEEITLFNGITQSHSEFKEKSGEQLFLEDLDPNQCYVWRTLFRREFIENNHLRFVPEICFQDVPFTHECYIKAKKCLITNGLLNIYRIGREGSNTASFDIKKAFNYCEVIKKTWELTSIDWLNPMVLKKLQNNIHTTFNVMIYSALHSIKNLSDIRSIIDTLNREVPSLRFTNGIFQKAETILFKKAPLFYIKIRKLHWKWIRHYYIIERQI